MAFFNHGSFNSKSWFLSSQIHHQGAVPTLDYTVLCYNMEKKKEQGEKGHFVQNHCLFFTERFQFHCLNFNLTSNSSPGSCAYSKLARCAMAWRRRRSTGKKGREGLFFNHHQLGLATKEVTRLAATAHHARRTPPHAAARRAAQTVVRCGVWYTGW